MCVPLRDGLTWSAGKPEGPLGYLGSEVWFGPMLKWVGRDSNLERLGHLDDGVCVGVLSYTLVCACGVVAVWAHVKLGWAR